MSANDETPQLDQRAMHLLKVLVDRYIRDGHPVGSRTLSRDSGLSLSPATIRNVMADLEDMGLIAAPHTSAGRVPTPRGYRCFVDSLLTVKPLSAREVDRLRQDLEDDAGSSKALVKNASRMLSDLTHLAGVVTLPRRAQAEIRQVEFLGLSGHRILTIIVLESGEVQNRIVHTDREFSESELTRAANLLNDRFTGRTLEKVRDDLLAELKKTREHMNRAMLDAIEMAQKAFESGGDDEPWVLRGQVNLMEFEELSSVDKLKRLFEAFNERRGILHLLDQSLSAEGVQIFIGDESGYNLLDECSVVAAPYTVDDEVVGVLGVIGPTRMAYERVIPVVDITARLLGSALNSGE